MDSNTFSILMFLGVLALFYSFVWMRKEGGYEPKIVFITSLAGLIGMYSSIGSNNQSNNSPENVIPEKTENNAVSNIESNLFVPKASNQGIDSTLLLDTKFNRIAISTSQDFEIDGLGNIKVIKKNQSVLGIGNYSESVDYLIPIKSIKAISLTKPLKHYFNIIYKDGTPTSEFTFTGMRFVFNETNFLFFINRKVKPYNNNIVIERPLPDDYYSSKIYLAGLFFIYFLIFRSIYRFFKS